jgi:hypothetical protein
MQRYGIALVIAGTLSFVTTAAAADPGRIDAYVTPYYNSTGPVVNVGEYSGGLASKNQAGFVATVRQMKRQWNRLDFAELYVGAIRLYDLGYRKEAVYWFYTAQYQGRLFAMLVDRSKLGGMGDPGFELEQAQDAFFETAGPQINGYAFGDVNALVSIIRRIQAEHRTVPDLPSVYPRIAFKGRNQWQQSNAALNAGLGKLAAHLSDQKTAIAQQRIANGTQSSYALLTSKQFPGGL